MKRETCLFILSFQKFDITGVPSGMFDCFFQAVNLLLMFSSFRSRPLDETSQSRGNISLGGVIDENIQILLHF